MIKSININDTIYYNLDLSDENIFYYLLEDIHLYDDYNIQTIELIQSILNKYSQK